MWDDPGPVDVLDCEALLDAIGARAPAPGVGSTAAIVGAMAAALCTKTARLSADAGAAAQGEHLRRRLTALAHEDAEAFENALRHLDEQRDPDPSRRDWDLGRSLATAADVPLRIAEACADVAELGAALSRHAQADVQPDAAGAAVLAEAAARVCAHLVAVNLGATVDDDRVRRADALARAAGEAASDAGA